MAEKPIYSFRIEPSMNSYLHARSKEYGIYTTDVLKTLIKVGLEHTKETKKDLKQKKKLAVDVINFAEADALIKNEMKKVYLLNNFKKLTLKLKQEITDKKKIKNVIRSLLSRIEITLGKKTQDYKEAEKWAEQILRE